MGMPNFLGCQIYCDTSFQEPEQLTVRMVTRSLFPPSLPEGSGARDYYTKRQRLSQRLNSCFSEISVHKDGANSFFCQP